MAGAFCTFPALPLEMEDQRHRLPVGPAVTFRAAARHGLLAIAVLSALALADGGEFEYRMAVRLGDEIGNR